MYVGDFDGNGSVEQIVTCFNGDSAYPFLLRHDLVTVLPYLKKKYLKYADYKNQTIGDIFNPDQLSGAIQLKASCMESSVLINDGNGKFTRKSLPTPAQLSPIYGIVVTDVDHDGNKDILMAGNFYQSKPETGIYDGSYGCYLKGNGRGDFLTVKNSDSGFWVTGAVRDMAIITTARKSLVLVSINNQKLKVLTFNP